MDVSSETHAHPLPFLCATFFTRISTAEIHQFVRLLKENLKSMVMSKKQTSYFLLHIFLPSASFPQLQQSISISIKPYFYF